MVVIAASFEPKLRRALSTGYKRAAEEYIKTGLFEPAVRSVSEDLARQMGNMYKVAYSQYGRLIEKQINKGKKDSGTIDMFEAALANFVKLYTGLKVTQIDNATIAMIAAQVQAGMNAGEHVDEIGNRIRSIGVTESKYRAHMISRTETHAAMNAAGDETARQSGRVKMKEWIPVNDYRTRRSDNSDYDHVNVDPVPITEKFLVSGEYLRYPGDPAGSAGNIINCRCAVGYIVD